MLRLKKYVSLALALLLALSLLPSPAVAEGPTVITTVDQLVAMTENGDYILGGDIKLSYAWVSLPKFSGTLDGNGYTISGLTDALFENLNSGGTVQNLNIVADIKKSFPLDDTVEKKAAAVAHNFYGTLQNVHVSGTISLSAYRQTVGGLVAFMDSGLIENCSFDGTINSDNSNRPYVYNADSKVMMYSPSVVGGLVGASWFQGAPGNVSDCAMTGTINVDRAEHIAVGGIVGMHVVVERSDSALERCVSSAAINTIDANYVFAGGIAGYAAHKGSFTLCISSANIDASAKTLAHVGGIAGFLSKNAAVYNCLIIDGSYTAATIDTSYSYVGGIFGGNKSGDQAAYMERAVIVGNVLSADFVGGAAGWTDSGLNVRLKNCYYDNDAIPVGNESADTSRATNVVQKTLAEIQDRTSYDIWDTQSDFDKNVDFNKIWIIPEGSIPTLLWSALNIPEGTLVVDTNATGANGDGFQSGSYIGTIGTDVFGSLAAAVTAGRSGNTVQIAANIIDFTFTTGGYAVTLAPDGGKITSLAVASAGKVKLPTPTKSGYTFAGWKAGETPHTAGATVTLTEDTEFTAQWTANASSGAPAPKPDVQVKENADGSTTTTTEQTKTAQDGSTVKEVTQTTADPSGNVAETQVKTTTSKDGSTIATEQTVMQKDAAGTVISAATTNATTMVDPKTGIAATTGTTAVVSSQGTVTTAFAEAKLTAKPETSGTAVTTTVNAGTGDALISALKQSEQAAAATGSPVSSSVTIDAATGNTQTKGASVVLPQSMVAAVAAETRAAVVIATDAGQIELSSDALSAISAAGTGSASISISIREPDGADLSPAQASATAVGKAFVIEITAMDTYGNSTPIHGLGSGEQIVRLPYAPVPGEDVSTLIVYYTAEDGTSQKMGGTYNAVTGYMEFRSNHNSLYVIVNESSARFADVSLGDWYYNVINYALTNGLMNGVSATEFRPDMSLDRATFVTILYRLDGQSTAAETDRFSDVLPGQWYSSSIGWATRRGLVTGYEDGTFRPFVQITREEMAVILYRYAMYVGYDLDQAATLSNYEDADTLSAWASTAVRWAVAEGLISGVTTTKLDLRGTANRAQAATVVKRFSDLGK